MTFEEYRTGALTTATYPEELAKTYLDLGIRGEAGEVCDKIKKMIRDNGWKQGMPIPQECIRGIALELGDVMWYAANISAVEGVRMTTGNKVQESDNIDRYFYDPIVYKQEKIAKFALALSSTIHERELITIRKERHVSWIIYCVGEVAACIGMKLSEICQMNLDKLADRKMRNMIGGSGDER